MTPSGIEPATFRFVAQYLNHCATISGPPDGWMDNTSELVVIVNIYRYCIGYTNGDFDIQRTVHRNIFLE
jgi:hypothetical protein